MLSTSAETESGKLACIYDHAAVHSTSHTLAWPLSSYWPHSQICTLPSACPHLIISAPSRYHVATELNIPMHNVYMTSFSNGKSSCRRKFGSHQSSSHLSSAKREKDIFADLTGGKQPGGSNLQSSGELIASLSIRPHAERLLQVCASYVVLRYRYD